MPSLPEDLVILAVGARPRGGPDNGKLPLRFPYGLRGAILVALTLAGRVEVAGGEIVVRDPRPLGDPGLDEALADLAAVRKAPVAEWMEGMPAGFVTAYFERMEAAGVLRSETVWLLFIARRKGYRLADPGYFERLRAGLRSAVTDPGQAGPAMMALAGVVHAGHLAQLLFPGRENAAWRATLAELASQDPTMTAPGTRPGAGPAGDPFRYAVQSAVHHSVHAAVSAAVSTSHHHGGSSPSGDSSPAHHHH